MTALSRAWFVSDVHLNPDDPRRTRRFLRFLSAARASDSPLFILGDLFDYWLGPDHAGSDDYREVLSALADGARAERPAAFVSGNRDFLIDRAAHAPAGLTALGTEHALDLGGTRTLLVHGDRLCTRDAAHQRLIRAVQNRPVREALKRFPLAWKRAVALRARVASVRSMAHKDPGTLWIPSEALAPLFRRGFQIIVCGHVHTEGIRRFRFGGQTRLLYTLADWGKGSPYLEWAGGAFRFRRL